jgi:hypothetical protein
MMEKGVNTHRQRERLEAPTSGWRCDVSALLDKACPGKFVAAVRACHGDARAESALLSYTPIVVTTASNTSLTADGR